MKNTLEQTTAEQATGITENPHGLGTIYAGPINHKGRVTGGGEILPTVADRQDYLREGGQVAIPNAGAGSYRKAFAALGFTDCKVFEWSSSAGDWTFMVCDNGTWYPASQSNRYPRHGFNYSVDFSACFESAEDCQDFLASY